MSWNLRHFVLFFTGSFICLYLTFSAAVTVPYVAHDSIRYFHKFYNRGSDAPRNLLYQWDCDQGRPVLAVLESFIYDKINNLSDLLSLRLIAIAVVALSAALLAIAFVSSGLEMVPSFCLSVAVFTLPGVQEYIFVPFLSNVLAIFISLLAYLIWSGPWLFAVRLVLALGLLELSFFDYPPSVFMFLVPTAAAIIFRPDDWPLTRKIWLRDAVLWMVSAAIFFVFLKLFYTRTLSVTHHYEHFSLNRQFLFIKMFMTDGAPQIFNFWNIYYSRMLGVLIISFTGVCVLADLFVFKKYWKGKQLLAFVTIFILCSTIWFFFGGYMPRIYIASQAVALALVYRCGTWLIDVLKIQREWVPRACGLLLMTIGLISANRTMIPNVWNNNSELMFVRSRVIKDVDSTTKEIHLVRLKDSGHKGYNGLRTVYDNFNSVMPAYEIPDLIRVAIKDTTVPFELHCNVIVSNYGEGFTVLPDTVVIDMNDLADISRAK